jgi:hypothetical protein
MTPDERTLKIAIYGSAHDTLVMALERYPREMWHFRPTRTDFSIHEIVLHITDSEANSFVRCRHLIAQPGSAVSAYDEAGWARALDYHSQSTEDALELFRWLRGNTLKLICGLPEHVWSNTIHHPENGVMTMDEWLEIYARHIPEHVGQMERVYQTWRGQGEADKA